MDAGFVAGVGGCELVARGAAAFVTVSVPACVEGRRAGRGQIVDVETQEPLEGVVVLVSWEREAGGHPALPLAVGLTGYWGSEDVLTNVDGRVVWPSRPLTRAPWGLESRQPKDTA